MRNNAALLKAEVTRQQKVIVNLEKQVSLLTTNNEDQARKIHDLVNELHRIKGEAESKTVDNGQVELLKQDLKEITEALVAKDKRIDNLNLEVILYARLRSE